METKVLVQAPMIHLNGTGADTLKAMLNEVYNSLEQAADDLKQAAPNQRDYYLIKKHPDMAEPFELARTQHMRRLRIIRDLQKELEFEMELIDQRQTMACLDLE